MTKRPCPACAEAVDAEDAACRFCGERLRAVAPPQDEEHLRVLSICHYVLGGITALFACIPFIHVALGLAMVLGKLDAGKNPPPEAFGWIFVIMGGFFILAGWTLAVLLLLGGRNLARRRGRGFCTAVAALSCLFMPLGTILGVFTLVVLNRPTVRRLFDAENQSERHAEKQSD